MRINKDGWSIADKIPILFKNVSHELPQVIPLQGGSIKELFEFLNVPKAETGYSPKQLLIIAWLVAAFIPDFPHPILTFYGPHGSAKTTNADVLQSLIDPSSTQSLSFPKEIDELAQIAAHHHLISFDNLSTISQQLSDMLCRICTGGGFSKRKLYSDQEDIIFQFRRVIMLNGINIALSNADLLDRALLVGLERFTKFGSVSAFWQKFEEAKPRILGAVFDLLVKALNIIESVSEDNDFRMVDFARYGCAVAEALGLSADEFTLAYRANMNKLEDEALAASVIGSVVVGFMRSQPSWEGTPTDLHRALEQEALYESIDTKTAYLRSAYHGYVQAAPSVKRHYLSLFWEKFDVSNGVIITSCPTLFFRELLKLEKVFLRKAKTQKIPNNVGKNGELIISNTWLRGQDSNLEPYP